MTEGLGSLLAPALLGGVTLAGSEVGGQDRLGEQLPQQGWFLPHPHCLHQAQGVSDQFQLKPSQALLHWEGF